MGAVCISLAFFSCGSAGTGSSGGTDDGVTTVSGTFAPSLLPSVQISSSVSSSLAASSLTGLEVQYLHAPMPSDFADVYTTSIDSNGSFSFDIPEGHAFIAFLVDPSQALFKVKGILGIGTGLHEYWEAVETSMIEGELDLGTITADTVDENMLISENDLAAFSASGVITGSAEAEILSQIDDGISSLKNAIDHQSIHILVSHVFHSTVDRTTIKNNFCSPGLYSLDGYEFDAMVYSEADQAWSDFQTGETVTLTPPEPVADASNQQYDNSNPVQGTFFSTTDRLGRIVNKYEFKGENDGGLFQTAVSDGYWMLNRGGNDIAAFDCAVAIPITSDTNLIAFAHPTIKVNIKPGTVDEIESFEIKWYYPNESTGEYRELSPDLLERYASAGRFTLELIDYADNIQLERYRRKYFLSDITNQGIR